jgi:CDP-glucose 4,6-dehydratase
MNFLKNEFYKNKKVLITGHTGFKGSWLSIWLTHLGAEVVGIALDPKTEKDLFVLSDIQRGIKDYREDIRNMDKIKEIFQKEQPEIVFHLAAQPLVIESYHNPVETYETNIMGTVNILEAIRRTKSVKAAVMITSDKCYDNKEWAWGYRENDPMGGHDPYSSSKGAAEIVIGSYRNSFFREEGTCEIASARAGNVIGGGDWSDNRLFPDIIRAIESNKHIELRNPLATRPWQHVLEPLGGYLLLAAKMAENIGKYSEAWNFGPYYQDIQSVKEVVEKVIHNFGKGNWKDISSPDQFHEANMLSLDISKAISKLNWKPRLNFKETIQMTTEWYKNYKTHPNILEFTTNQIIKYTNKLN